MNGTTREERIRRALARFEANCKTKQSKRKAVKLFSVDWYEPERERAIIQRKIGNNGAPD